MWCLSPSSLLVYDDISHRAFRSLRDQLMISLSLRLWLMRILIEIAFWNLRKARPQSVTAATYKCRLDGKTRDGTRENNLDSFYNGPGFYASRVGFASSPKFFLRRCTASRVSRTCPFKGASTHASEGHEGKTRGCARRCGSELAINRSTSARYFPLIRRNCAASRPVPVLQRVSKGASFNTLLMKRFPQVS